MRDISYCIVMAFISLNEFFIVFLEFLKDVDGGMCVIVALALSIMTMIG